MRFKIELELKNERLLLDYRPAFISLFKHSLSAYDDGKYFDENYEIGKDKLFTFAVGIPNSQFSKDIIIVPNKKINIIFSTGDIGTGIVFFNALSMQKNKSYPLANENTMTIKSIIVEKEYPIISNTIEVMFKSPLCVREHNKELNSDMYYSYEKQGFNEAFRKVLESQIDKSKTFSKSILDDFQITPIRCKKTVVRHHSQFVEATVGSFKFTGNVALLSFLYTNGIGSRKSSGFGLFEIIGGEMI